MDMFSSYKSPLGYKILDNGLDSYGVNHTAFSLQDELKYQFAREQREKQIIEELNKQGISDQYPQYSTNFWNRSANNNYGFGNSNIESNPISFDDIYYSQKNDKGILLYKGIDNQEGGFSNRKNDLGKKTNYGITQFSLDEYNAWDSNLKKGINFPKDVRLINSAQAKQIMDEMYYQRYGVNHLYNLKIARNVFDELINQGTSAGRDLADVINKLKNTKLEGKPIVTEELASVVNNLSYEDSLTLNDMLSKKRMDRYFDSVDRYPVQNINNLKGWYNRVKSHYSNDQNFENLYRNKVDEYILKKYPQYYDGK